MIDRERLEKKKTRVIVFARNVYAKIVNEISGGEYCMGFISQAMRLQCEAKDSP